MVHNIKYKIADVIEYEKKTELQYFMLFMLCKNHILSIQTLKSTHYVSVLYYNFESVVKFILNLKGHMLHYCITKSPQRT